MNVCEGWCGECYANVRGRAAYKGHRSYRPRVIPQGEGVMSVLRRRDAAGGGNSVNGVVSKCALAATHPGLFEFITADCYGPGEPRVPGTVLVFVDSGLLKACLSDRDQGLVAFVSGASLQALLRAIEDGLRGDNLDWRQASKPPKRK